MTNVINDLLLLSKNDIPFISAGIAIRQPTIKEIGYIGEERFYEGCNLLNFSKEYFLSDEDKDTFQDKSDFDVLLALLNDKKSKQLKKCKISVSMLLSLMFPNYNILLNQDGIFFKLNEEKEINLNRSLNANNFNEFKLILKKMFCLKNDETEEEYNPGGPMAQRIVNKLKERHKKIANQNSLNDGDKKIAILSRYISILAVGEHKDMNDLLNYTVYQLFDEFDRYKLNEEFKVYIKAKMAGAKDLTEPDDWMKDIH